MNKKLCSLCGEEKLFSEFHTRTSAKDGKESSCINCASIRNKKKYAEHREFFKERVAKWQKENPLIVAGYKQKYRENNRKKINTKAVTKYKANPEQTKKDNANKYIKNPLQAKGRADRWKKKNPSKPSEYSRIRTGIKKQATPIFADIAKINTFYIQAKEMTVSTGIRHVVDHIIPLKGKNVCGFHCETNLQILTMSENSKKSNRFVF